MGASVDAFAFMRVFMLVFVLCLCAYINVHINVCTVVYVFVCAGAYVLSKAVMGCMVSVTI